jgi:hypothetical protein
VKEVVYNLIGYFDEMGIISFLGISTHELDGTDEEKLDFLSAHANDDSQRATRFILPEKYKLQTSSGKVLQGNHISLDAFRLLLRANRADEVFDQALDTIGAPKKLLVCVTPVYEDTATSLERFEAFMHRSQYRGS